MLDVEVVIPNMNQQYKSLADGGARVVFDLNPVDALLFHTWLMKKVDVYGRPIRMTLEMKKGEDW